MSVNVDINGHLERCIALHSTAKTVTKIDAPSAEFSQKRSAFFQTIGKCLHSAARFVDALRAAQALTRQAERYYAMSDRQLARIGLTRDEVPIELRRALERNQFD
jgi:uncharacterized protein YjiS (DUF1127 family)